MDKKLAFVLKLNGHDHKEDRFKNIFNLDDLVNEKMFNWESQPEGIEYWWKFYHKVLLSKKIPKDNKLNRKLYPDFIELLGE